MNKIDINAFEHSNAKLIIAQQLAQQKGEWQIEDRFIISQREYRTPSNEPKRATEDFSNMDDGTKKMDAHMLQKLENYIYENIAENISLDDMARTVHLSKFYFSRRFKKTMNTSPHQYLIRCRMEKAKNLLQNTDLPITDIAYKIGYDNLSNFIRTFRKVVKITPKQYQKTFR